MLTSDFDYALPEDLIAQRPPETRGTSRMMVIDRAHEGLSHKSIADIAAYLNPGDLLVLNDTRVFPARALGQWKDTPGAAEILLLDPLEPETFAEGLYRSAWRCMCGSGRKQRVGKTILLAGGALEAHITAKDEEGNFDIAFTSAAPLMEILAEHGLTPVPPYIHRSGDPEETRLDRERYQTVYAANTGAVAAPTAGLHFTDELLAALEAKGIRRAFVTLHVGPGTFKPVKAERVEAHKMDAETYEIPEATAQAIADCRARGGRVIAVGSTSVRTLETVAAANDGKIIAARGRSSIFIYPPYTFRAVDAMLTNFHLPQSTLLMMISALAGRERILAAYEEAVAQRYRFFSYGDCMLIL